MRHTRTHRAAFTLIELTAVMVLLAILATTAIPTINRLRTVHEASLAQEVARRLTLARAHATTTGIPTAVQFNLDEQRVPFLILTPQGVEQRPQGLDNLAALNADQLANIGNAAITAVSIPTPQGTPQSSAHTTLWFDYRGTPHLRTPDGSPIAPITQTATVTLAASFLIAIQPSTGHIAIHQGAAQ